MRNEEKLHQDELEALFDAAELRFESKQGIRYTDDDTRLANDYATKQFVEFVDGSVFTDADGECKKEPMPDPRYVPVYTKEDVDKIVMMLTLWIPDIDIRNKLEEVYQCWKDTQKN